MNNNEMRMFCHVVLNGTLLSDSKVKEYFDSLFCEEWYTDKGLTFGEYLRVGTVLEDLIGRVYVIKEIKPAQNKYDTSSTKYCSINFYLEYYKEPEKELYNDIKMPYLKLRDGAGNILESSQFGQVFKEGVMSPGIGSTIIDNKGKRWTVKDVEASTIKTSNSKEAAQWTFVLTQKDIDI